MKKITYSILLVVIIILVSSCATKVYTRTLVYKKAGGDLRIHEKLEISGENFIFTKETAKGKAVFKGKFEEKKDTWIFRVGYFKPVNAQERYFDPPIVYIYRISKTPGGIQFASPRVKGGRSPIQFIMRGTFVLK